MGMHSTTGGAAAFSAMRLIKHTIFDHETTFIHLTRLKEPPSHKIQTYFGPPKCRMEDANTKKARAVLSARFLSERIPPAKVSAVFMGGAAHNSRPAVREEAKGIH